MKINAILPIGVFLLVGLSTVTAQKAIPSALDNAAVDVHTLLGRTRAREFFHEFLEQVISDNDACSPRLSDTERAIVVVQR